MALWGGVAGKRVLITGATNGIGLAAAIELGRRGAQLTLVARSESKAAEAVRRIRAATNAATSWPCSASSCAMRCGSTVARRTAGTASLGIRPSSAHASQASNSTCNHLPNRDSSVKIAAISAGV